MLATRMTTLHPITLWNSTFTFVRIFDMPVNRPIHRLTDIRNRSCGIICIIILCHAYLFLHAMCQEDRHIPVHLHGTRVLLRFYAFFRNLFLLKKFMHIILYILKCPYHFPCCTRNMSIWDQCSFSWTTLLCGIINYTHFFAFPANRLWLKIGIGLHPNQP
jgi:hypothetical protein